MIDRANLERELIALGHPRLLIIGDLILDRYVTGDVDRISPEAPIPVLRARHSELRLGGAGNVVSNLRAMDAEVRLIGAVGDDELGRSLSEMVAGLGVETGAIVVDAARPTIEKTRMLSGVQQMLRVDWEDPSPLYGAPLQAVLAAIPAAVAGADGVVLSDYGKGLLTPEVIARAIECARAACIPVLVDPKGNDFSRYRGATLITPNKKEAETALGRRIADLNELTAAADELIAAAELESIVITLGAEGIYHRTPTPDGGREGRSPAAARAVYDVTGAGDTVVAHLALYLASGMKLARAVALANQAAGLVVGRLGTNSVTRAELRARLAEDLPPVGSVLDGTTLDGALEAWRREGQRVVFTNGCFDVLHVGHVSYLRFARSQGDVLLVGVNDDASVRRLKGGSRPVNPLADRMAVLAALEMVDAVVAFSEDTPQRIIERVTPDVLVKGEDWKTKGVVGREWVESHGGQVVLAPLVDGKSTTRILERARDGSGVDAP